jgi:signal transduction histidine kinase
MAFLSDVCRIICEIGGYRMVWVGYAENGSGEKVRPIAWTGVEQGYLKRVTDSWGVAGAPKGPASIAIDTGKPSVIRDVRTLPASNPWRGESLSRKYLSILGLPLITGGKTLGAIGIYSSEPDTFDEEEIHLLSQLADDLAFGIVSLRAHRDREKAEAQLRVSSEQLRKLAAHLQTAREAERTHIAREIHDELGQALTALKMDLVWTEEVVRGTAEHVTPESILNKIEGMYTLIDNTIGTMRRIATELRPVLLDSLGLSAAMEWQAEEFQNRTGIVCRLEVEPEEFDVDRERSTAVFRILQEALTNVARHSEATIVVVTLQIDQGALCLSVKDNGKGIADVEQVRSDSFGLLGMRERVLLFGGNVTIDSGPGLGTKLDVRIPLAESGLRVSD